MPLVRIRESSILVLRQGEAVTRPLLLLLAAAGLAVLAAMVAATVVISQFGLNWGRPEDGFLVGLSLGAFLLVPNGIAWALGPVLICELSIASYYFADYCSAWVGRLDLANGAEAYAFGNVPSSPVGMLVGQDGALYVLTQSSIVRFSAP